MKYESREVQASVKLQGLFENGSIAGKGKPFILTEVLSSVVRDGSDVPFQTLAVYVSISNMNTPNA